MKQMEIYNRYIEQEDGYYKRLETLEQCQCAVFDHIFRHSERLDKLMVEEVLIRIHQLEDAVRLELLHLRLEKALLAFEMKETQANM